MKILCTLGPASFNEHSIKRLTDLCVSLFRINLSHTSEKDLTDRINMIREFTDVPICLDTEGAQVRTGIIKDGECIVKENSTLIILNKYTTGDSNKTTRLHPQGLSQSQVEDLRSRFEAVIEGGWKLNLRSLPTAGPGAPPRPIPSTSCAFSGWDGRGAALHQQ